MNTNILKLINDISSGSNTTKNWTEMSAEEKCLLETLLSGSEINPEDFLNGNDFYKYDELTYSEFNVYLFQPYFDDFERIHTMPEELKEMISYGGDPDEFMRMSDEKKRKYIKSLCLNINDYYEYFQDEDEIYITQSDIERKQDNNIMLVESEYDAYISECEEKLTLYEDLVSKLEQANSNISFKNKVLDEEIKKKSNEVTNARLQIEKIIQDLFDEKIRYLILFSSTVHDRLSLQRIERIFSSDYFSEADFNRALAILKRKGIRIVKGQEIKQPHIIDGDYTKTKAFKSAIEASQKNSFSEMDDWQSRFQ